MKNLFDIYVVKKLLPALLLFLAAEPAAAGSFDCFYHLPTWPDEIKAVYPDSSGRIWIGTIHGMMRLGDFPVDSHNYSYYPDAFSSGVYAIQNFDGHRLLIRTLNNGKYVIYNPDNNGIDMDFENLLKEWGIGLENRWSLNVKTDSENNLWIFSGGNLYLRLVNGNKTFKIADLPTRIRSLTISDKEFCYATNSKLYVCSVRGLKTIQEIPIDNSTKSRSLWLAIDKEGNIWTGEDNLLKYDRKKSKWETIRENIYTTDMTASLSGDIIVATNYMGLLRYDSAGNLLQEIRHIPYDPTSLAADNVRAIFEDSDSTLWVCYNKRLISVCNPGNAVTTLKHIPNIKRLGFEDDIISLNQDNSGNIWFGSNSHGVFKTDRDKGGFVVPEMMQKLDRTAIPLIYFDSKKRVWTGTYRNGIYCRDGGLLRHFLPEASAYSIVEDKSGNFWFGMLGNGIYFFDKDLKSDPELIDTKGRNWILEIIDDGNGCILAASSNGLIGIDINTHESKIVTGNKSGSAKFKNHNFQSVYKDSRGLIWLIGQELDTPLEILDPANDTILEIPRLKGQIMKSIVEDNCNNIWIASEQDMVHIIVNYDTSTGRHVFIPSFYRFRNSGEKNSDYYNYRAAIKLNDGKLLFGSSDGFRMIDPENFPPFVSNPDAPKLFFASIKVNDSYLMAGTELNGRQIIDKDVSKIKDLSLRHNENNLIISIGSNNHTASYNTDIYYRLEGRDSEWRIVRGNTIELPDLDAGDYILEVCSEKADGTMSDNMLSLSLTIESPWYDSVCAWFSYMILFISLIAFSIYFYLERQKQKLYVAQIKKEADRQYQLNEMKLRFFTNISHDFRTPLSLIITPLEAFMSDEANKASEKVLKPVYKNAVRLLNLINQILDFRKIDVNGAVLNLSYGDIVSFVKGICSSFTLFAEDTGKRLLFESSVASVNMYFDKDKVSKIMMNLLSNSFKFSKPGGDVKVTVRTDGGNVVIDVADNGPGIPDDKKSRIFDRFYQSDNVPSDYQGSGIGLHIVKEFVTIQNGSISVSDNLPSGSVFSVSLPVVKSVTSTGYTDAGASEEESHAERTLDNSGKVSLLLVEDNPDFREFMKDQLSDRYKVFTAKDGHEALKILDDNDVKIIVSDIMMEGMDGLELCKKVKSNLSTSHIPVILLTAKALAEDEMLGFECGADEYVTKPFNMSILRHRISKLIEESQKSQKKFKDKLDVSPSEITITSLDEQFLANAIRCVEENMGEPGFSVETMSSILGVHRTQLYKKLVSLTGKPPAEFIRLIRLKRAAQYLAKSQMFVSEIAYTVGFSSPKLFTKHFKEEFGMSPRDYQNEHSNKDADSTESDSINNLIT